jgi:hypothetical protein
MKYVLCWCEGCVWATRHKTQASNTNKNETANIKQQSNKQQLQTTNQ